MNSSERILSSIREESERRIAAVNEDAEKYYSDIIQEAKKKAEEIRSSAEHKVQLQSEKLVKAHKSRAELERRNALLRARRTEIEKALEASRQYMLDLPDGEYFDLILKLASKLSGRTGTVYFNSKDISRLPKDLGSRFRSAGLDAVISKDPDETIDGGFILKSGDIEENMSFSSVINEKREQLEDMIGRELFRE